MQVEVIQLQVPVEQEQLMLAGHPAEMVDQDLAEMEVYRVFPVVAAAVILVAVAESGPAAAADHLMRILL